MNELAEHVNTFLLADLPAGTVSFNTKQFAAYVKSYVQLGADQAFFSVSQLVEKLDAVNLRCLGDNEDNKQKLFYGRVLSGLGEVCEDAQVVGVLGGYFASLASEDEQRAVNLVAKLVDLDVTHALTWVVFHSDDHIQRGVDLVEIMESYLTLEHLYGALKRSTSLIDKVFAYALAACQGKQKRERAEYRDLVFLNKNQSATTPSQKPSLLKQVQHEKLDILVAAVLSIFSSVASRTKFVKDLVAQNGDWKAEATHTVVVSLLSGMHSQDESSDEVASTLKDFFAQCDEMVVVGSATEFLEYQRLVTRVAKEEEKLSSVSSAPVPDVISLPTQETIVSRLQKALAPSSSTVVEVAEWIAAAEYASALSRYLQRASSGFRAAWESLARLIVTHAIAGKSETAKITALMIHKRDPALGDRRIVKGDEEQIVLSYSNELVSARLALMRLVSAMYESNPDALHELAAHYREALLSTVLCALSESAELKASIVTTYVALVSPSQCYQLAELWFNVEEVLANALPALRSTLTSIHDVDHVNRLVLESFGGIETLASLFQRKALPAATGVARVAVHSGFLQRCSSLAQL